MAYNRTGGTGNDRINESASTGPGTIFGLEGNDSLLTGSGEATVNGGPGDDDITLHDGNTGIVDAGPGNDEILGLAIGAMIHFGGAGADTFSFSNATIGQTIAGGADSSDAGDEINTGSGPDLIFGNGGNDTVFEGGGDDTIVAGFGNDCVIQVFVSNDLMLLNQGNDFLLDGFGGFDTIVGGQGNDCIGHAGSPLVFLSEGNDTFFFAGLSNLGLTVNGGVDDFDGGDHITGGFGSDSLSGNGGNDTILGSFGNDTHVGGVGADLHIFATDSGRDELNGFYAEEGDRLDFSGQTYDVSTSNDGDVLLILSGGGTVQLNGIAVAAFSAAWVL
jgi:Ca2+-binding RTX toxin-like protein